MSASNEVIRDLTGLVGASILVKGVHAAIAQVPPEHYALRTHANRYRRKKDRRLTGKRAGQLYEKVGPGNYLSVGLRGYAMVSTKDHNNRLDDFSVDLSADKQHVVRSKITWGVYDIPQDKEGEILARAKYNAESEDALTEAVLGICGAGLYKVMKGLHNPETATSHDVRQPVIDECHEELAYTYGIELRSVYLLEAAESIVSAVGRRSSISGSGEDLVEVATAAESRRFHVVNPPQ